MTTFEALDECSIFASALLSLRMGNDSPFPEPSEDHSKYRKVDLAGRAHAPFDRARPRITAKLLSSSVGEDSSRKRANVSSTSSECSELNETSFGKAYTAGTNAKIEKKGGKATRGRYKCSLCGELKTNHVCALVPDKLMCSVGTQSCSGRSIVLTPQVREAICGTHAASASSSFSAGGFSSSFTSSFGCSSLSSSSFIAPAQGEFSAYLPSLSPSLDLSVPQACLLNSHHGLSNLSSLSWSLSSSSVSGDGGGGSCTLATPIAAEAGSAAAVFQERVITVSRNRASILAPVPGRMDTSAATAACTSKARAAARNPQLAPVREEVVVDGVFVPAPPQQLGQEGSGGKEGASSDDASLTADDTDGDGSCSNGPTFAARSQSTVN